MKVSDLCHVRDRSFEGGAMDTGRTADLRLLGEALANARRGGELANFDLDLMLGSSAEAEEVQRTAVAAYGDSALGWKIGATNGQAQERMSTNQPFFGPLTAGDCHPDGV